jgi:hypothetical protein
MTSFEGADTSFTSRAPSQGRPCPSRARFVRLSRQHDMANATVLRGTLIGSRRKSPIGDGQLRGVFTQFTGK